MLLIAKQIAGSIAMIAQPNGWLEIGKMTSFQAYRPTRREHNT